MSSREIAFAAAGVGGDVNYIEDVFSTYLYTGTGLSVNNTITNGIDLAAEGGLVWTKARSVGYNNALNDTARGFSNYLISNSTGAQNSAGSLVTMTANSNGYTVNDTNGSWNESGQNFVSWTFRKQPKFFDIVTYAGNGVNNRAIPHSLGSAPGMVIVKRISGTENWPVWHRSVSSGGAGNLYLNLNLGLAGAKITDADATTFTVIADTPVNEVGSNYVAYLFAHDAGGFGASGADNVISCGSFTIDSSGNADINLGYEPQYILVKGTNTTRNWWVFDVMRGMSYAATLGLQPNTAIADYNFGQGICIPTATGFNARSFDSAGVTWVYMAIRRPMKVPTDATTVFSLATRTGTGSTASITGLTSTPDALLCSSRDGWSSPVFADRLRGFGPTLVTVSTSAEGSASDNLTAMGNTSITFGADSSQGYMNWSGKPYVNWMFSRRPGFFDEVCYTGNGTYGNKNHNLGVIPELIIAKQRNSAGDWYVWNPIVTSSTQNTGLLNSASAFTGFWSVGNWATSTTFLPADDYSGSTYVAYLFATCPGVSKVGSYTGTGATQTINCGFTGGARFVLIKRTDSTGNWYVWDTARGMVSGTDPSLLLNSTAAEVNANSVYTATTGFQIVSTAAGINASGGSYIFLAIA